MRIEPSGGEGAISGPLSFCTPFIRRRTQPPLRRISGIDPAEMLWNQVKSLEVNAFHQMGSWHLLALAFALCTSSAIAQEGQQVPKTMPAGPAITPGVEAAQGKGSAWVKLCQKNEQTGNKQLCLVKYEGLDPNTGMPQITVAARSVEGEDKQTLLIGVTIAYTLVIPIGVQIKIDDNQPIPLKYAVCLPVSPVRLKWN